MPSMSLFLLLSRVQSTDFFHFFLVLKLLSRGHTGVKTFINHLMQIFTIRPVNFFIQQVLQPNFLQSGMPVQCVNYSM